MDGEKRTRRLVQGVVTSGAAVLLLAAALTLLAGEFVREQLIRPLLFFFQMIGVYLGTIPQLLIWFFLLLLVVLASARLLRGLQRTSPKPSKERRRNRGSKPRRGPIIQMAQRIEQAPEGEYFKWRVRRELQDFLIELLAWRRGISTEGARTLVRSGAWTADPAVREFFRCGFQQRYTLFVRLGDFFSSLIGRREEGFKRELSSVLDYLEAFAKGQEQGV